MTKVFTYLKQHDPGQAFCAVVLFANRNLEPKELTPYRPLLEAGLIRRFLFGRRCRKWRTALQRWACLFCNLIRQTETQAPLTARELVARTKTEIADEALRVDLIELIETVIIYKLPRLSREEIQTMLQIHDIRQSRVYQEAMEEGEKKGIEKGIEKGVAIAIPPKWSQTRNLPERSLPYWD